MGRLVHEPRVLRDGIDVGSSDVGEYTRLRQSASQPIITFHIDITVRRKA